MTLLKVILRLKYFFKWNDLMLITGINRGKIYVKNMGSYVLIGRPNVGEKKSYSILNFQSKELGS